MCAIKVKKYMVVKVDVLRNEVISAMSEPTYDREDAITDFHRLNNTTRLSKNRKLVIMYVIEEGYLFLPPPEET